MAESIEWLNRKAREAKARGDYRAFECWRRAYLNAQAATVAEREREAGSGTVESS